MAMEDIIKENDLVRQLDKDKQYQLINAIKVIDLPKDHILFHEGDLSDGCYFILSGEVKIFTTSEVGELITLARLGKGDYFGEQASLYPPYLRNASAMTITPVKLGHIAKNSFLKIIEHQPKVVHKLSTIGKKQIIQKLKYKSSLFSRLSDEAFHIKPEQIIDYLQNDVIFREGDEPDAVYFILHGEIKLTSATKQDAHMIRLSPNNLFGELAVIENKKRYLTATVNSTNAKLIRIEAEHFKLHFQKSKYLQEWLKSLQMIYQMPGRGFVFQNISVVSGIPCISIVMSLIDNRQVLINKLIGLESLQINIKQKSKSTTVVRYKQKPAVLRELSIADHKIVGINVMGYWENLPEVCEALIDGKTILPIQVDIFSRTGSLNIFPIPRFYEGKDILCNCMKITYNEINNLIQQKTFDLESLCLESGAGMVCGSCRPKIAQMLGKPFWMPARIEEIIFHSEQVKSFRFKKLKEEKSVMKPGQHVIIQCVIQGNTIERSYTLTNSCTENNYYEITIKKESHGLFSRWIFDPDNHNHLFKISSPQGQFSIDFEKVSHAVFFAGGIGITPAIAFARSLLDTSAETHLFIDYSVHQQSDGIFLDLLKRFANDYPDRIGYRIRFTEKQGRLSAAEISEILIAYPQSEIYICGPTQFEDMVKHTLHNLGIPHQQIHIEVFKHATAKPTVKPADYPQDALGCPLAYRGKVMGLPIKNPPKEKITPVEEAKEFLKTFYTDVKLPSLFKKRYTAVKKEFKQNKTYFQTTDEIVFGAKLAWRNSTRCIGRDQWQNLLVRDLRHLEHEDDVFAALLEHIKFAINGGNLQPLISVFAPHLPGKPAPRIWNHQLLRYAGYKLPDGNVLGDPSELQLTQEALSLGWRKSKKSAFDILPILIQMPYRPIKYYEIPKKYILEVAISHPKLKQVESLNLKWYAVPIVSDMCLAIGGIRYTAAPFNGWYMETEIGARNFGDVYRYNILPKLAEKLNLDMSSERTLWRDEAIVILNEAVLYSFERAGVKMIDHHTASRNFLNFGYHEIQSGEEFNANWSWIVPPISASTTGVFHQGYHNIKRLPNFLYQKKEK